MSRVCGIDPGLTGAVAFISEAGIGVIDTQRLKAGTGLGSLDEHWMKDTLVQYGPDIVVIERQQPFPEQGVGSTFKTGYGFGLWLGICIGLGLKVQVVHPQVWQREMLLGAVGEGKERNVLVARRLFPQVDIPKSRHGRADALLLAEWGRRHLA